MDWYFPPRQLLALARAYRDATGVTLHRLGQEAAGNPKLFSRLEKGGGCNAASVERASRWFIEHVSDIPWPAELKSALCERGINKTVPREIAR